MTTRLFDAFILVDWSAASKPVTGPDSIWVGTMRKDVRFRWAFEAKNPATRAEALKVIELELAERKKKGERVLLGFDFPLGFPRSFAERLQLNTENAWKNVWAQIVHLVRDKADNVNNRFSVGANLNRKMMNEAFPFWGCPASEAQTMLLAKRPRAHEESDIPEFRYTEEVAKGAHSIWKLFYNGSVGGQALVGIPIVSKIRDNPLRAGRCAVWPFETGLRALDLSDVQDLDVVIAEIYPSLIKGAAQMGEVRDQTQLRGLAEHLAGLDDAGKLGALFAGLARPGNTQIAIVESEEGWILGA